RRRRRVRELERGDESAVSGGRSAWAGGGVEGLIASALEVGDADVAVGVDRDRGVEPEVGGEPVDAHRVPLPVGAADRELEVAVGDVVVADVDVASGGGDVGVAADVVAWLDDSAARAGGAVLDCAAGWDAV